MYFSVGILYSSYTFMQLVKKTEMIDTDFLGTFRMLNVADASVVLKACIHYNWISINEKNKLYVTPAGNLFFDLNTNYERLRSQLYTMICVDNPLWSANIYLGRAESSKFFPTDVSQCFEEAQLLDGYSIDIVNWWDKVADLSRGRNDIALNELGRYAEVLSIKYEQKRTNQAPQWIAIDSNLAGYDIISQISSTCVNNLMIEVKGCRSIIDVRFHLSRNEWETALLINSYQFHIWHITKSGNILFILSPTDIIPYIPTDTEYSKWDNITIILSDYLKKERKAI